MSRKAFLAVLVLVSTAGFGCSKSSKDDAPAPPAAAPIPALGLAKDEVTLTLRNYANEADNYLTSTYSFFYLNQGDKNLTHNGWDIEASPSEGGEFLTEMVVGDIGLIADLGAKSCQDIENRYEEKGAYPGKGHGGYPFREDRVQDPKFWFNYSEVGDVLAKARNSKAPIVEGHCYVIMKMSSSTKVEGVFHVKRFDRNSRRGKSLIIDEIEVFNRATLKEIQ